ncbi:MAG: hypothetical protein LUB59_01490 [Candidatus Gastranaerophilales bacterium]|nr:hypothetical protein [Candidatus Gastranaerophilales bacterium]
MTINYDDSNNDDNLISESESIFEGTKSMNSPGIEGFNTGAIDYESVRRDNFVVKLLDTISRELLSGREEKEQKRFQKQAEKLLKNDIDILKLLSSFGCIFVYNQDYMELRCEQFNLTGKINTNTDGKLTFDDTAIKILYMITDIIEKTNNIDSIIDSHEQDGFYPVGELTKQKIMLDGKECEVLTGKLSNNNGETRQIYYYNGKEVFPD